MHAYSMLLTAALAAVVLPAAPLDAQRGGIEPGSRVRITAPGLDKEVGSVLRVRGDTLLLEYAASRLERGRRVRLVDTTAVLVPTITRLELSTGRRSNIDKGVRNGLLIGAGIGLGLGIALAADDEANDFVCDGAGCVASGVAGGALWGLLIGLAIGAFSSRDEWRPVMAQPTAPVALIPTPDGRLLLSAAITF